MNDYYELLGSNGSPYSRKLLAILRYRRLPHIWRLRRPALEQETAHVKPYLQPMLKFPGDSIWHVDTTPLIYELERRHAPRSIVPPDAGSAFLAHLVEDFADEWLTKAMFYYRWCDDKTARCAAHCIAVDTMPSSDATALDASAATFMDRQRGRMALVGCDAVNAPIIEASFHSLLAALGDLAAAAQFLFGDRPCLADFGLYGQLTQLVTDPLPQRIVRERAPSVEAWVMFLDDASGCEGEWDPDEQLAARARKRILELVGTYYIPFLRANAAALRAQRDKLQIELGGLPYEQVPFGYQLKCLNALCDHWNTLDSTTQARLLKMFEACGCDASVFSREVPL